MSKIHDALKKIQQERRMAMPAGDSLDIVPERQPASRPLILDPVIAELGHAEPKAQNIETSSAVLRDVSEAALPRKQPGKAGEEASKQEDIEALCFPASWRLDPNRIVFCEDNSSALGAEQFRTLRARLLRVRDNQTLKKLHITSAISGEGKTFVASNLAHAFARQGSRRVLLIDADLRNPGIHLPIGAPLAPGLSDFLRADVQAPKILQHGLDGSLYLISAGNIANNPGELLSNGRFKILLERLAPLFDWIIIDSPPCLPVADASLISAVADGVLLVVRAGSTPGELSQKARQELHGRNIVGVVLNAAEEADSYYGQYSYGYGAYGAPDSSKKGSRTGRLTG